MWRASCVSTCPNRMSLVSAVTRRHARYSVPPRRRPPFPPRVDGSIFCICVKDIMTRVPRVGPCVVRDHGRITKLKIRKAEGRLEGPPVTLGRKRETISQSSFYLSRSPIAKQTHTPTYEIGSQGKASCWCGLGPELFSKINALAGTHPRAHLGRWRIHGIRH